jgi:hypothetical protein
LKGKAGLGEGADMVAVAGRHALILRDFHEFWAGCNVQMHSELPNNSSP